ncbi:MAG: NAD(P)/FAD-dependent oxidoreductase [Rhodospirillales bacterium]
MSEPHVVVVGAGAAGVGAGLELRARGIPFVILEAAQRVGGRAFTDSESLPRPWDQGCHWLHCADVNPLVAWADRLGATYRREVRGDHFAIWTEGRFADTEELQAAGASLRAAYQAIEAAAARGEDLSVAEVLPDAGPWSSGVRSVLQAMAGDDPERVSAAGYADYEETDVNWPVLSGYGDLIGRMAAGLPLRLGVAVTQVDQGAKDVRVETTAGPLKARAAIVTVSTNVLTSGRIGFGPGPARELLDLVAQVPCGAYEKIAFALRRLPGAVAEKIFCTVDPGQGAPALDFQIMDGDPPLMIAHIAGGPAREVTAAGRDATIALAKERLSLAFGSAFPKEIQAAAVTGWTENPFVQGSYSHAAPGKAYLRHEMIAADSGNLAFAGEAFSRNWQATAHGAYQSGRDVASRVAGLVG